jgi:hypothetical protein
MVVKNCFIRIGFSLIWARLKKITALKLNTVAKFYISVDFCKIILQFDPIKMMLVKEECFFTFMKVVNSAYSNLFYVSTRTGEWFLWGLSGYHFYETSALSKKPFFCGNYKILISNQRYLFHTGSLKYNA